MRETTCALLDNLPNELIIQILQYCSYKTIFQFSSTCKKNYKIVVSSISLRLHIELEVNGLEVVKTSTMNSKSANSTSLLTLKELNLYRDAWLKPDFDTPVERPVGHPKVLCWKLHNEAYFKAYSSFAPQDYPDSLEIITLNWLSPPPPVSFRTKFQRFAVDPGQNLAILVAAIPERPNHIQLHIRSLTTGQPHPDAERPELTVEFDFEASIYANSTVCYAPEVLESVLVIQLNSEIRRTYEILTWDWKSGRLLHRISSRIGTCASRFISSSHLAVFSATAPSQDGRLLQNIALSLYDIDTPPLHSIETSSNLSVFNCPILDPAIMFQFPKLRDSHSVSSIALMGNSDPVPCRTIYTSSVSFAYSRSVTLGLCLSLFQHPTSQNSLGGINTFRSFVSTSRLLDHLDRHRKSYGCPVVPFSEWGAHATRWFPENEVDLPCSQMSGSRYITAKSGPNDLPGHHYLVITDFNTPIVQRHQDSDHLLTPYSFKFTREGDHVTLVNMNRPATGAYPPHSDDAPGNNNANIIMTLGSDAPSTFDAGFEEVIVSRLPCRIIICARPEIQHDGWLLDGNRIIGIKVRAFAHRY
ncbi:putative F-box protein [Rhizoctonia solani 123E]|uniref:Putative F-box protein n=1 Tax=Rhizoctonia solani 123E TaxID=1423351 RepID=A0A074RSL6_9AGAM|nr:putative F-box protein [Rhizoctonia solani 123E]